MDPFRELPAGYDGVALRSPTLPPLEHTNCYLIGHDQALIVDPGTRFPRELHRLRQRIWALRGGGGSIAAIFLTHHHPDHIAGAPELSAELGVPLAGHPLTLGQLPVGCQTLPLDEGAGIAVDDGARQLDVLWTPGHAPGHLCLFERARGVLIAGDMVPGVGTVLIAPPDGEMAVYLEALARLAALDPQRILPAHGPIRRDGRALIKALIDHRIEREERVLSALRANPRPLLELAAEAYAELPPTLIGLASLSALAHLIKLEADGQAARRGEAWLRAS